MTESEIQARILLKYGALPGVRLFRNTVGFGYQGDLVKEDKGVVVLQNARPVTFGLCPGSSDIIGWKEILITPDMIGETLAVFSAIEVKTQTGRLSKEQKLFGDAIENSGGFFWVGRSVDDLKGRIDK